MSFQSTTVLAAPPPPQLVDGLLNSADWDFNKFGSIKLTGTCEFYWEQLLSPVDFETTIQPQMSGLLNVPGIWSGSQLADRTLSRNGYGTIRFTLLLQPDKLYGLKIDNLFPCYKLWVNGQLISQNGQVGTDAESSLPYALPRTVIFSSEKGTVTIVAQVANFHYNRALIRGLEIGTAEQMMAKRENTVALEFFLVGTFVLIGLYHLAFYYLNRKDRSPLYFALFCVLMAFWSLTAGKNGLPFILAGSHWNFIYALSYLTAYTAFPIFILYTEALFPQESNNRILVFFKYFGISTIVLFALMPSTHYTYLAMVLNIIILAGSFYLIYTLLKATVQRRPGSAVLGCGLVLMLFSLINDLLHNSNLIFTNYIMPIGMFLFIISQALFLLMKFAKAFSAEAVAHELRGMNNQLEQLITEKTTVNHQLQKKIHKVTELSITDLLTKAYNRVKFNDALAIEISRLKRYNISSLSLIMFDIDHFKKINDTYGHDVGDQVLVQIAGLVKKLLRPCDVFARWGGEEFMILCAHTNIHGASILADHICATIERHNFPKVGHVTCSIGVCEYSKGEDPDSLTKRADQAMYAAKRMGRNQVQLWSNNLPTIISQSKPAT